MRVDWRTTPSPLYAKHLEIRPLHLNGWKETAEHPTPDSQSWTYQMVPYCGLSHSSLPGTIQSTRVSLRIRKAQRRHRPTWMYIHVSTEHFFPISYLQPAMPEILKTCCISQKSFLFPFYLLSSVDSTNSLVLFALDNMTLSDYLTFLFAVCSR